MRLVVPPKRNPPSEGFVLIGCGGSSYAYAKNNIVEVITESDVDLGIDSSKDILVEARRLCDENSKKYLPDIKRKRIEKCGNNYEFVYEMPLYSTANNSLKSDNDIAKKLTLAIDRYNVKLHEKPGDVDDIILELVNNTWKDCDHIEVLNACNALIAINRACFESPMWDLKSHNIALNGNQLIFLDPIFLMTDTSKLLKLWKKNGFTIPK